MTELNEAIKDIMIPERMRRLPISAKGFPVPWFVASVKGEWDFRVIKPGAIPMAHNGHRCWLCGEKLGQFSVFTIGPMCTVNRVSAEPPSHLACAEYAVRACPFLTKPNMRRNEKGLLEDKIDLPGVMILRNPGAVALWSCKTYSLMDSPNGGVLFRLGTPAFVHWYTQGRPATRIEVMEVINSGVPILEEAARQDGPEALLELQQAIIDSVVYLPPPKAA